MPEMLGHEAISHLLILGSKAQKALTQKITIGGVSVHEYLSKRGKTISYLPHPSGANRESIDLASLDTARFPKMEQHQERMWAKYKVKQSGKGKALSKEESYKSTRASRWKAIEAIRQVFDA